MITDNDDKWAYVLKVDGPRYNLSVKSTPTKVILESAQLRHCSRPKKKKSLGGR